MRKFLISSEQHNLLYNIFYFKSLTVPQVQNLLYAHDATISREKRLYQIFNSLRYMGLIEIAKPLPSYCKHRTHYLSEAGLIYVQEALNIKPNKLGDGWHNINIDYCKVGWCDISYEDYLHFFSAYKYHHQNIDELAYLYSSGIIFRGFEYTFIGNDLDIKVDEISYSLNMAIKYPSKEDLLILFEKYKQYLEVTPKSIDHIVFLYYGNSDAINEQKVLVNLVFEAVFKFTEKPRLLHLDLHTKYANYFI